VKQSAREASTRPTVTSAARIRRSQTLLVSWRGPHLVLTNYRTQVYASAEPETVRILHLLSTWRHPSELFELLPEYSRKSIRGAIRDLLAHTLLVREGDEAARLDDDLAKAWEAWLPHGSFHFATKDVEFRSPDEDTRIYARYLNESPQPALYKRYREARKVRLPREPLPAGEFARVLMARKTHREYSRKQISLSALSRLLDYTWGVRDAIDAPPFGRLFHKTSPSGGARHPGEVYVLAIRVKDLRQGLYHYDCLHHRLEWLRPAAAAGKAVDYTADHEFLQDASALFLMTAVFPRTMWKYRFPRAYRVVLLDAGHLCQTFCLVATWLGLAPFCTAALRDSLIEKDLGIDGIRESVIYVAGVGTPLEGKLRSTR
jgi:SagB-type dehydrogenase family enzyme